MSGSNALTLVINMMTAKALEILAMPEDEFNRRNEAEMAAEIERLRARIAELEAIIVTKTDAALRLVNEYAVAFGTMGTLQSDEPATITHGHPPSAPPHDE